MKVKEGVMQDAFKNPRFLIAPKSKPPNTKHVMLGLISLVDPRPKPGETGKEPGLKKAENHTLAINYTLKPINVKLI